MSFQEDNRLCPAFALCASGAQPDRAADIPTMQRKGWPHMSTFRFSTGGGGGGGGGGVAWQGRHEKQVSGMSKSICSSSLS